MPQPIYTEADGPFQIKIVFDEPCGGEEFHGEPRIVSTGNDLDRAIRMVEGIKRQATIQEIRDNSGYKIVSAYYEPEGCPRPMSPQIQAAICRVEVEYRSIIAQQDAAHARTVADRDRMAAEVARPGRMQFYECSQWR
jgi:hypothetical protein